METSYELQLIDCNCNDCKFMVRDFERLEAHKKSYEGTGLMDRLQFGNCNKFNKPVSFLPNTCMIETQECFEHRKSGSKQNGLKIK
jgi:hypothetical protein